MQLIRRLRGLWGPLRGTYITSAVAESECHAHKRCIVEWHTRLLAHTVGPRSLAAGGRRTHCTHPIGGVTAGSGPRTPLGGCPLASSGSLARARLGRPGGSAARRLGRQWTERVPWSSPRRPCRALSAPSVAVRRRSARLWKVKTDPNGRRRRRRRRSAGRSRRGPLSPLEAGSAAEARRQRQCVNRRAAAVLCPPCL